MTRKPKIVVLAGVNGAGKSSIAGEFAQTAGDFFYNPDTIAKRLCGLHTQIPLGLANAHAWQIGRSLLKRAIAEKLDYRFETTLGGRTISDLLAKAARSGHELHVWFCGLESADLHIRRVRSRVARGGHAIPEAKIHERWTTSRENLVRLMPLIHHLRVYDNSEEADPADGKTPRPVLLLEMQQRKITASGNLPGAPIWAQPLLAAAMHLQDWA